VLPVSTLAGVVAVVAVIAGVTALAWHGTINGEAAVSIYSTIIAGGGAAYIKHAGGGGQP
jgi:hypothetical protein